MTRYSFHTVDGGAHHDEEGVELASHAAARMYAVKYASEIMESEPELIWAGAPFRVKVANEAGKQLFTVTCSAEDTARNPA